MVAPSVALSADHTGGPNNYVEKHGEELADSRPWTIPTLPSVIILSAVCIAQN